jgi:hypothetical protein
MNHQMLKKFKLIIIQFLLVFRSSFSFKKILLWVGTNSFLQKRLHWPRLNLYIWLRLSLGGCTSKARLYRVPKKMLCGLLSHLADFSKPQQR